MEKKLGLIWKHHSFITFSVNVIPSNYEQSQWWSLVIAGPIASLLGCRLISPSLLLTVSALTDTSYTVQSLWDVSESAEKRILNCGIWKNWSADSLALRHPDLGFRVYLAAPGIAKCLTIIVGKSKTCSITLFSSILNECNGMGNLLADYGHHCVLCYQHNRE